MPPKTTRTPERIEIGGGFYLKQLDNGNYTLHWADGERFNGAHVLSPQEAAALQSPAPNISLISAVAALEGYCADANAGSAQGWFYRLRDHYLPQLRASLQSPAGEWRVEQLVALCVALENAYNGVNGDLPPHLWEQMRNLRKDWNERTAAGSLPPAPTGEG